MATKRTKKVNIAMTHLEFQKIDLYCKKQGIPMATYLRNSGLEKVNNSEVIYKNE